MTANRLTGDCEIDCQTACAYPGRFSECSIGALAAAWDKTATVGVDLPIANASPQPDKDQRGEAPTTERVPHERHTHRQDLAPGAPPAGHPHR